MGVPQRLLAMSPRQRTIEEWLEKYGFDLGYYLQELSTEGDELLTDGSMEYTESGSEELADGDMEYGLGSEELADGDMEAVGVGDWTADNGATLTKQTTNPYEGLQVLRVATTVGAWGAAAQLPVVVGKYYRIVGVARSDGTGIPSLGDTSSITSIWNSGTISTNWQSFVVDFVAESTRVRLANKIASSYVEFDNVSVKEILTGSELVTNGGFDTDTGWTKGTGWDIDTTTAGKAHCDGSQVATTNLSQSATVAGLRYLVIFTVSGYSAGTVKAICGGSGAGTIRSADGTYIEAISEKGGGSGFTLQGDASFVGDIDNVSVKEILGCASWTPGNSAALSKEYGTRTGGAGVQVLRATYNGTSYPLADQSILTVGKRYRATGWFRGDGAASPYVIDLNGGGRKDGTSSTNWQYFDVEWEAGHAIWACVCNTAVAGYAEFDDVSVVEVLDCKYWTPGNNAELSKETGTRTGGSGTEALRVTSGGSNAYAQQTITVIGKRYRITGWARGDGSAFPKVSDFVTQLWFGSSSVDWQYFDVEYVAQDTRPILIVSTIVPTEYCEFDDVTLIELIPVAGDVSLAQNKAVALGRDLVLNGDFATDISSWVNSGWDTAVWDTGTMHLVEATAAFAHIYQGIGIEIGKTYSYSIDAVKNSGSTVFLQHGANSTIKSIAASGTYTGTFTAVDSDNIKLKAGSASEDWNFDNIVIKQTNILASSAFPGAEELDESGDGTADKDNWTAGGGATLSNPSIGILQVSCAIADAVSDAQQAILIVGKRYRFVGEAKGNGVNGSPRFRDGTTYQWIGTISTSWQSVNIEFVATGTLAQLITLGNVATLDTTQWRNLSITETNPLNTNNVGVRPGVTMGDHVGLRGNGLTSYAQLSTEVNSIIDPADQFTIIFAAQVDDWAAIRYFWNLQADANNFINAHQIVDNLVIQYKTGGTLKESTIPMSTTGKFVVAITGNIDADEMKIYVDAVLIATHTGLGTFLGNLLAATRVLMALNNSASNSMLGELAYWAYRKDVLSQPRLKQIARSLEIF